MKKQIFILLLLSSYCLSWSELCTPRVTICLEKDGETGVCVQEDVSSDDYGCPYNDESNGIFKGVIAYTRGKWAGQCHNAMMCKDENGNDKYYPNSCSDFDYQCVGLIKRFYREFFKVEINQETGSAINFYTEFDSKNLKIFGLTKHANGGNTKPMMGDILVFSGGGYGHVSIICGVNGDKVTIFEQNWNRYNSRRNLDYSESNGIYTITGTASYPVLGWLHLTVGSYSDGYHEDGSSQAIIDKWNLLRPKIGYPTDHNGGSVYVHEWEGVADNTFSIISQDYEQSDLSQPHYGTNGKSILVLNDLETPKKAYLLAEGFLGHYSENDGPYEYGVPFTEETTGKYANSHLMDEINDFIQPSNDCNSPKMITVQKFKRRLSNGTYYNNERRTLVYDPDKTDNNIEHFELGEFSIEGNGRGFCSAEFPCEVQWYVQGFTAEDDIAWPMEGVKSPTGKWFTKSGTYHFAQHDENGNRIYGVGFTAVITEGNYQFSGNPVSENLYPPSNLFASASENDITLTWDDDNPEEYDIVFQVYRSISEYGVYSIISAISSKNYTDTDLDDGEYCYKVSAVFEGEESYFSNTACKTIGGPPESATLEPPVVRYPFS